MEAENLERKARSDPMSEVLRWWSEVKGVDGHEAVLGRGEMKEDEETKREAEEGPR